MSTKKIFFFLLFAIIVLFQANSSVAEESSNEAIQLDSNASEVHLPERLSLKKALEIANKNNPSVKAAIATLPVSEAQLIIAKYIPNPIIGSNSEFVKQGSIHPVQIGQTLEVGRKRYWRIQVAKNEISKTELEIAKVLWETRARTHIAYSTLSIAQELFDLAKERLNFYKSLLDITEKRFQAGDGSGLEVDRTNMELLSAENDLDEANKRLKRARVDFNGLLGLKQDTELGFEDSENLKPKISAKNYEPLKKALDEAINNRLEIAILEKDFGITRAKLKKARWERIPNFYVEGGPARPNYHDNIWGPYIGAEFELPLFNRRQGEIKEAKAQIGFLEEDRKRIENDINIEVKNSLQDLELTEQQVERFEQKLLGQAENILEAIKKGYQIGRLTLTDVLNAEQKNRDLRQKYLESLLNYQTALASLEYAVGVPVFEM